MRDQDLLIYLRNHFRSVEADSYDVLDFVYRYGSVLYILRKRERKGFG
jgi:hypothetical protein